MSDFFTDLETELRRATVRRAAAARAARISDWRRAPIAAAVAAIVLLALSGALLLSPLGGGDDALPGAGMGAGVSAPSQLAALPSALPASLQAPLEAPGPSQVERPVDDATQAVLGVMRRPQRAGERDRAALVLTAAVVPQSLGESAPAPTNHVFGGARVLLPSMRAVDAGSRARVLLVPIRPDASDRRAVDGDRIVVALALGRPGRSDMVVSQVGVTPPAGELVREGHVAQVSDRNRTVVAALVPDGVARVELRFPAVAARAGRPALTSTARTVAVHDNVAAVSERRLPSETRPLQETWFDAQGEVVLQIARAR